ncbi:dihydrofolate reductase family protein [Halomarina rubra]|uniref:Dihydrofolate reductase family protein n=1 Tax=Halomarina rubra TaxID=2071873 RepID=A0ABD6AZ85_9EURY|nr:dihydrofolate reductase family protein [Halomarina rubra]
MTTQYYTATSIDGYIADEEHSLDWLFQFGDGEEAADGYAEFFDQVGALAMGSTTYEWVVDHEQLRENPGEWPYEVPTWVFTTRALPVVEGADVTFVEGDVAPVHAEMVAAARGENVWLVGGGDLVGQFHDEGLLDEVLLTVAPVTLGSGAPLLPRRITDPPLKLVSAEPQGDEFAVLTYEVRHADE